MAGAETRVEAALPAPSVPASTFLKLGWLANPFAFVAIFTLIALMAGLVQKFALSPGQVGLSHRARAFAQFVEGALELS